jgi:hypothetical protein
MKGDYSRFTFKKLKHFAAVLSQQGRVLLDSEKNEDEAIAAFLRETSLTDIIGPSGVPLNDENAFRITSVTASDFTIQAGHMYVDGILVEADAQASFTGQPYRAADVETVSAPAGTRTDLVYLEVWQQHVTALEDPDIREKALNIPDTTTRLRTLWRVHIRQNVGGVDCNDPIANFPPPATATRLTNSVSTTPLEEDPCVIAPDGGFRLLENRLLRVEIHKSSSAPGGPTAKWSAENAAVVYGISAINPVTLTVSGSPKPGLRLTLKQQARDQFLSLGVNDLVEIVSGEDEIRGNPGVLGTVHTRISDTVYDVLLNAGETVPAAYTATPLPQSLYTPGLVDFKVRRWDGLITDMTTATDLGNTGVSITFPTVGPALSGDYWAFAGRTANVASADESLEKLTNAAPKGVRRHYARLALIQWNGSTAKIVDCRPKFPPLTDMIELHYVSGDGQEARPGQSIKPLIVRVSSGGIPLKDVEVSFTPGANSGTASPASPLKTDSHGLASVDWTLSANVNHYRQQVTAALVDEPDIKVIFNANLSLAAEVNYVPADPNCYNPPVDNVKDALDQLCKKGGQGDEPGIRIKSVVWAMDKKDADNNSRIPLSRLMRGLIVETDQVIAPDSISRATCFMVMEIPMDAPDQASWLYPIVIRAKEAANANEIRWMPISLPASLLNALAGLNSRDREEGLLARFTLKGNFIRDEKSELYLDGEDYGVPDGAAPFNLLPLDGAFISGNKRIGGDFYMWFWVVPEEIPDKPQKPGFMVTIGSLADQVFAGNQAALNAYVSILDNGIDRPKLDPAVLPPGYEPLPKPYNLAAVKQQWAKFLQMNDSLAHGDVLVFAPDSLRALADALSQMWTQINPDLHYQVFPIPDNEVEGRIVDTMKQQVEAGKGFALIFVSDDVMARAVAANFPQDFDFTQFRPI